MVNLRLTADLKANYSSFFIDMKYIPFISIVVLIAGATMGSCSAQKSTRDYAYEAYCDSIWANDPDYYLDVLCTTDEFQEYIEANGQWW